MAYSPVAMCFMTDFFSIDLIEFPTNYICSRVISNFILYTKGYFEVTFRW